MKKARGGYYKLLSILIVLTMIFSMFTCIPLNASAETAGGVIVEDSTNGNFNTDIKYNGNWYIYAEDGRHGGTKAESTDPNASVEYKFSGTGIDIYSHICPQFGSVKIKLDGNDMGTYSLSDGNTNKTRIVASFTNLLSGSHTIEIISQGGTINIDYFDIYSDVEIVDDSVEGNLNPDINYQGDWYPWAEEGRYGGTKAESTDSQAALEYTFSGVGIEIWSHINPTFGQVKIILDGENKGVYSLSDQTGTLTETKKLASFSGLLPGEHTLRIENESGKINVDYFKVLKAVLTDTLSFHFDSMPVNMDKGLVKITSGTHNIAASYTPSSPEKSDILTITQQQPGKEDILLVSETLGDNSGFLIRKDITIGEDTNGISFVIKYNDETVGTVSQRSYSHPKGETSLFKEGDRVGLIGDSITHDNYSGMSYSSFIYDYYVTRFPNDRIDLINLGICSYTAQAVLDRFDLDVAGNGLNKATIMLGMNDVGIELYGDNYENTQQQRNEAREKYNENMRKLISKLDETGISPENITLITPSIYDQTVSYNYNEDGTLKTRVNDGLEEFSKDVNVMSEEYGTQLVKFNEPMLDINEIYHKEYPDSTFTQGDLIHPNPMGHNIMGYLFLQQQGAPSDVAYIEINGDNTETNNCVVSNLKSTGGYIRFNYKPNSLPMAVTDAYNEADMYVNLTDDLNREIIKADGLDNDKNYILKIDGNELGEYSGYELSQGVNIAINPNNPGQQAAQEIEKINQERKDLESNISDTKWYEYLQRTGYQYRQYIVDLCDYSAETFTYTLKENAYDILNEKYSSNIEAQKYYEIKSNPDEYQEKLDALREKMYKTAQQAVDRTYTVAIVEEGMNVEVTLPNFFAENMVLQREKPHTIWGKGIPNQEYTVTIYDDENKTQATAVSDENGNWKTDLQPLPAKTTPYRLEVTDGFESKIIDNIFVGDVFVCAGQSNMELRYDQIVGMNLDKNPEGVYDRSETPELLTDSNIKFFTASWSASNEETFDVPMQYGSWSALSEENGQQLSYLAMYFAENLREREPDVPVGLMTVAWGGTPITRWLKSEDASIYNSHIAPLTNYKIAGILWYQGEDDAEDTYGNDPQSQLTYKNRMTALINEYRDVWNESDLPFLYVQLARYSGGSNNGVKDFQAVRQAQLEALSLVENTDNVEMITSIDTDMGTAANIHPLGKEIIAKRMADAYENMMNGEDEVSSGPIFEKAEISKENSNEMIVYFKDGTAEGLQVMTPVYNKTATPDHYADKKDTNKVSEFEIAGADKVYYPAEAVIDGNTVKVSSENVSEPVYVRYAYDYSPECPDLYNSSGLPASPFTSEKTYKVVTIGDSITEGFGVENRDVNRYSNLLEEKLNDSLGLGDFHVVNRGRSGTTMNQNGDMPYWQYGPWREALKDRGDIYTIALGTNDSKPQNFSHISQFKDHYTEMINTIKEYNPNAKIYLCVPVPSLLYGEYPPNPDGSPAGINNENILEIGKLVKEIAEENGLEYIDLYSAFDEAMSGEVTEEAERIYGNLTNNDFPIAGKDTMTKYLYDKNAKSSSQGTLNIDRIHPGAYGHELIAQTVFDVVLNGLDDEPEFANGDVNQDGNVDVNDATLIQKFIIEVDLSGITFDETLADVNGDGIITISDATCIQISLIK